ncbi:transcriptional regulator [Brevibacterium ravenspurgense]|uniref:Transcriptional regulator n=1 Tax=Brevibacterium ravenspurgense TaxID=479117 RepID=A0A2I1IF71_9MICO|nr:helix-turn-helix domain-containing protein [Brevibacterium ravenspurgense]PKY69764.1 transcriptional regulator [Brevibacterium ravenspurgense]
MRETQHEAATYETPYVDSAVSVFALLAHSVRVRIVLALRDVEMTVNHLADIVDRPAASVRGELATLEAVGVVTRQHEGHRDFYQLANEHAGRLAADAIFHAQDRDQMHASASSV